MFEPLNVAWTIVYTVKGTVDEQAGKLHGTIFFIFCIIIYVEASNL